MLALKTNRFLFGQAGRRRGFGLLAFTASVQLLLTLPGTLCGQTAPANDMFTNRITLTGSSVSAAGWNIGATKETGERTYSVTGGKSVWWTWTAPTNGSVIIDTVGSTFDTFLEVFTGASVSNLVQVAVDDDHGPGGASQVSFSANQGTVYQIAVDGCGYACGNIVLNVQEYVSPRITVQPVDNTVLPGTPVTLSGAAVGASSLTYQWWKGGIKISGASSATYSFTAQSSSAGTYSVTVSNGFGGDVSSNAMVTVAPVFFTSQPQNMTIVTEYPATFSASLTGGSSPSYQWQKNGTNIPGATSSQLTISKAQLSDSGLYSVRGTSSAGSLVSSNAALNVILPPYTFGTLAGGLPGTNDGTGTAAQFKTPHGITVDQSGAIYVADLVGQSIRKVTPSGVVTTLLNIPCRGSCSWPTSGPWGVAVDAATNVLVADTANNVILRIAPDGTVSQIAGMAGSLGETDGIGSAARFARPAAVAPDNQGNLYVADWTSSVACRIRRITPDGMVSTLAGSPGYQDGVGAKAAFLNPCGLGTDGAGNVFVMDEGNNCIRKVTPNGKVTTFAGSTVAGSQDGVGAAARFQFPHGGAIDGAGNIYVADYGNATIRKVAPDGSVMTIGGWPGSVGSADGAGARARFSGQRGITVDRLGNLYVADYGNSVIRKGVPFTVTNLPQSQAVPLGTPVTLNVSAAAGANGPFTYQWLFNNEPLLDQTNLTLAIGPTDRTNSGVYSVVVSNAVGNWLVLNATVRALVTPIIQPPQLATNGTARVFFQDADGGLPYDVSKVQVQWRTNLPSGTDTNWNVLSSGCYTTNGFLFIDDTTPPGQSARFYRVREW
jgi:hypothetical protein